jgi:hypothetical protein
MPDGTRKGNSAADDSVPLAIFSIETSKLALAVGASDAPVPPSTMAKSVMPLIVPPLIVGEVRVLLVSVAVLDRSAKTWAVVAI